MLDLSEERSIAKGHGSNLICPYKSTVLNRKDRSTHSRSHISTSNPRLVDKIIIFSKQKVFKVVVLVTQ